jgi:hypothetical protein
VASSAATSIRRDASWRRRWIWEAGADDVLIGTVPADEKDPEAFALGQRVVTDSATQWQARARQPRRSAHQVEEAVGPRRFVARTSPARAGRVASAGTDELARSRAGGQGDDLHRVLRRLMAVDHSPPIEQYGLAHEREIGPGERRATAARRTSSATASTSAAASS